ncbi:MAG: hypothetical protein ACRDRY_23175 [Pseudonocardiaceae bacterium]
MSFRRWVRVFGRLAAYLLAYSLTVAARVAAWRRSWSTPAASTAPGNTAAVRPGLATRQVAADCRIAAGQVLRRWYRFISHQQVTVVRVDQATDRVYYRRFRTRKRLFTTTAASSPSTTAQPSHRNWRAIYPVLRRAP